jgi:hypothetical protein
MKIALFKSIEFDYETVGDAVLDGSSGFARISEYIEVEFTPLADIIGIQIAVINKKIASVTEEFSRTIDVLKGKKAELLAITQDVSA